MSTAIYRGNAIVLQGTPPQLRDLSLYFLRLGALGFGGPVGLAHAMRRDLVDGRNWITEPEYDRGLAIAAACPGPLAYQLGVYVGFLRKGVAGAVAVAIAFALPPFALVVLAASLYVRFASSWPLRALFYGVGPVVVALIVKACWGIGRRTLRRDFSAWALCLAALAITAISERELVAIFPAAGLAGLFLFGKRADAGPPAPKAASSPDGSRRPAAIAGPLAIAAGAAAATSGGAAAAPGASALFTFFFKTGCLVFGSGLVIVPFLKAYVVDQYHWLGGREFLDAVAIGMISPGPVVISATFVGFLVDGYPGALAATAGIFTPAVLFTVIATPLLLRYADHPRVRGFLRGVTVAVVGVLAGTTWLVARTAVGDLFTALLAAASLGALLVWKRIPEPVFVALGAAAGLAAYPLLRPEWMLR
ncbi:MAG TPA: chromate efflux transporter [Thermoanaerobaculia bacterium]|nr:chromate efflux transporter [Thermoanaerobaculia bacterium]